LVLSRCYKHSLGVVIKLISYLPCFRCQLKSFILVILEGGNLDIPGFEFSIGW